MALRRYAPPVEGLRAWLAARDRAQAADYGERMGVPLAARWTARADALEAGEPVEIAGWELVGDVPGVSVWHRYVIEPDGALRRLPDDQTPDQEADAA